MKKMFMIQNPHIDSEKFLKDLSKYSGIPLSVLVKEFKGDNQILIEEHYFKNIYESLMKTNYPNYEELMDKLINGFRDEEMGLLFDTLRNEIEIFAYKTL